ncbi:Methionine ABC transporter ATP-binding protein [Candidatus Burkholderia brachyanthoides]|nr:Methionine ABC transporter ATP-binding protein [Candidatus Burkholderia brachyanthoides]
MPLLVMWTNIIALTGGAFAAKLVLSIDMSFFIRSLPSVVPIANLWIGLGKGVVFGMLIALAACHFGFRIKANSQSLGEGTTTFRRHVDHGRHPRGCRVRDPLPERGALNDMSTTLATAVRHQPPVIAEPVIEVRDLTKRYGRTVIHEHLNLEVRRGEIVALLGGSGSGKTTLVRQILGLEAPTSGSIRVLGEEWAHMDGETAKMMRTRSGMLFQQGALFSSLSVYDNIAQPFRELGKIPEDLIREFVMLKLEMVGLLCKHATKMPSALSGGMVKRVGIALEPEMLFLDEPEPTAGLDAKASDEFVDLIAKLPAAALEDAPISVNK